MFELLCSIGIVICTLNAYWHYRLKKHNTVLYRFCQLRRDIIAFIDEKHWKDELSKDDYVALCQIIDVSNSVIHYFAHYKARIFNLVKLLKDLNCNANNFQKVVIPETANPKVDEYFKRLKFYFALSFFAYTPFFRIVVAQIASKIFRLLSLRKNWNKLKSVATLIDRMLSWRQANDRFSAAT